ncbi:MAG: alpha/beta fold hydrolase [Paracoccaceae bacterium]|nr:alpha/beta fold hydrolase [Paracoccaceae bacterium]
MRSIVPDDTLMNGYRVAHGTHGTGEPVVLVHGTPSSSYIWRNVYPKLVDAGYKVHLFDLLGFGLSERPWDQSVDTSVSGQVPILHWLFDEWGLDTAYIVAHDIGGSVGLRFDLLHPDQAETLTVLDSCKFDSWPSAGTKQQISDGLEALIGKTDQEHRDNFCEWLLTTVENKEPFDADALKVFLGYISGPVGQASLFQRQISHYDAKHTVAIKDNLTRLGEPTMQIIWGEKDA